MTRALALAALLAAAGLAHACQGKPAAGAADRRPVPAVRGEKVGGGQLDLADFSGQVVLLNLWATWCEPCRKELPELARLHREHTARGFSVVGINVDVVRMRRRVDAMVRDFELPFPVLLDPDNETVRALEVVGYPTSFVIGRDRTILWRRDGIIAEDDPELAEVLEAAL